METTIVKGRKTFVVTVDSSNEKTHKLNIACNVKDKQRFVKFTYKSTVKNMAEGHCRKAFNAFLNKATAKKVAMLLGWSEDAQPKVEGWVKWATKTEDDITPSVKKSTPKATKKASPAKPKATPKPPKGVKATDMKTTTLVDVEPKKTPAKAVSSTPPSVTRNSSNGNLERLITMAEKQQDLLLALANNLS